MTTTEKRVQPADSGTTTAKVRHWLVRPIGASTTAAVIFLVIWQLADALGDRLPGPIAVTAAAILEVQEGEFIDNFAISMQRFGIGIGLSIVIGTVLGLAIGSSRLLNDVLGDLNLVGLAIPAVIWALLCTMWFGFGNTAPIVTIVLSAVPFIAVNVAAGARSIPPSLQHMSGSFAVPFNRRLRHVMLPAVSGYLFAGIRFAVMSGWNGLLLSEWFGASDGVGHRARYWYDANRMPGFLAWIAFFILFMVLTDRLLLERISRKAFRWRDGDADAKSAEPAKNLAG
ncbi:MAG: nitrate/sulfonate/bicarbonate transporter inner rane protein [Microbacteriaceae bacterium]|jgi:ABC-type nitrate/sulfonate/bicarbonate transport system permease component|nr:nitrate/sulfonate/bicarbonate transporter inner rane protein [Microbacteriaceae bacterium]